MKRIGLCVSLCLYASITWSQDDVFRRIQTAAIEANDGDTIHLPEGRFEFKRSLSIDDKKNIVLKGKGVDKTIISYKGQIDGAEGFKINRCQNIILQDFTIQDAKGDCIKILNTEKLHMKNLKAEWTGKPSAKNGAYALYPVSCNGVLIEDCVAIGASDAGIYVGQSHDVTVRNCTAKYNVAGIEIENCVNAEVYNNTATDNSGGILVFDLPGLPLKHGRNVSVYNNKIISNNYKNFAPKGNIVGEVPPGTGVMVMATDQVKIYGNEITDNRTASVSILSYYITERTYNDKEYTPLPNDVKVYENIITASKKGPSKQVRLGLLLWVKFGKHVPAILYDGIVDKKQTDENPNKICVYDNQGGSFSNLDAGNGFKGLSKDVERFSCK